MKCPMNILSNAIIREYLLKNMDSKKYCSITDPRIHWIHGLLSKIPWTIVDVNLAHKHLATLFPSERPTGSPWFKMHGNSTIYF